MRGIGKNLHILYFEMFQQTSKKAIMDLKGTVMMHANREPHSKGPCANFPTRLSQDLLNMENTRKPTLFLQ
jgi:hypothetical protein